MNFFDCIHIEKNFLYYDETVRKIMERHYGLMKEFRESEFIRKFKKAKETRAEL